MNYGKLQPQNRQNKNKRKTIPQQKSKWGNVAREREHLLQSVSKDINNPTKKSKGQFIGKKMTQIH